MPAYPVAVSINLPPGGRSDEGGDGGAHQVDEVVGIEAPADLLAAIAEALLEAFERSPTAFDVRVVGVEQQHVGTDLIGDPADVFGGVGRDPHLTLDELARAQRELLEPFLVT